MRTASLRGCEHDSFGPGLGGILPSQGDYFQATKGGGHGDYHMVVLAPSGVQEAADLVAEAFDIADEYRIPVMILGDGMIGQMMEPVEFKEHEGRKLPEKTWAANGWKDKSRPRNIVNSLYIEAESMEEVNRQLQEKYAEITQNETRVQEIMTEDAEYIIAAFGTTARIAKNAALKAREMGIKVGVIRPVTLWPFPAEAFAKAADRVKGDSVCRDEHGADDRRREACGERKGSSGILWHDGRLCSGSGGCRGRTEKN